MEEDEDQGTEQEKQWTECISSAHLKKVFISNNRISRLGLIRYNRINSEKKKKVKGNGVWYRETVTEEVGCSRQLYKLLPDMEHTSHLKTLWSLQPAIKITEHMHTNRGLCFNKRKSDPCLLYKSQIQTRFFWRMRLTDPPAAPASFLWVERFASAGEHC